MNSAYVLIESICAVVREEPRGNGGHICLLATAHGGKRIGMLSVRIGRANKLAERIRYFRRSGGKRGFEREALANRTKEVVGHVGGKRNGPAGVELGGL